MHAREDKLFGHWRASLPESQRRGFVSDGAVDPVAYDRSALKILLLLKEVNDPDGGGWCLRKFLADGGRSETWSTVTRWLHAIRNLQVEVPWDELENVTKAQRCEELRSIAAMNLKKIPGYHSTQVGTWWQVVERDRGYIRQQFALYEADLVVCCGSTVTAAFNAYIKAENAPEWQRTSRGVEYLEYGNRKYVVAYSHPEARIALNLIHYGLVDAVREIFRIGAQVH
jgi:hypothetical protein